MFFFVIVVSSIIRYWRTEVRFRACRTEVRPPRKTRRGLPRGGEAAHEFLLAGEQVAQAGAGGTGFDAALDLGEFLLGLAVLEVLNTTQGFLPGRFTVLFKQNLEEQAAVAFFQRGGDFGGLHRLPREAGEDQRGENLLRLETVIEPRVLEALRQFLAEPFGFREHANQPALDRFGRFAHKLRLELHLAAAFRGGFAKG